MRDVMPQISTIVVLMLENRSLDNVLGFLYAGREPLRVLPEGSPPAWNGVPPGAKNAYYDKTYSPTNGTLGTPLVSPLCMPNYDPGEELEHVRKQLYADGNGGLPDGDLWSKTPTMTGFAWDYSTLLTENQAVMGSYSAAQLPALHGLAESYAASDRWFASVPTQTFANRAFAAAGTSLGKVDNSEIDGGTFASAPTLFNVLGAAGKSWGIYWGGGINLGSGAPVFEPFTPWLLPQIGKAPNGGVHVFEDASDPSSFMRALAEGALPNFCFIEPRWGGGTGPFYLQGTDYHATSYVGPAEYYVNALYEAVLASPQWNEMLLVITFDEHGGTYDHEPPPTTVSPDGVVGASGFGFNRLGVRVPMVLVSPYIAAGTVFRSPRPGVDFDHTSLIATVVAWAGVDPASAGLGARVAQAPTFEDVLSLSTPRADAPRFQVDPSYRTQGFDLSSEAPPVDATGTPLPAKPMHLAAFRDALKQSATPEEAAARVRVLRYGVDR